MRRPTIRLTIRLFLAAAIAPVLTGCEALSPNQLWKLNRQPDMDRGDAYFSVPSEINDSDVPGDQVTELNAPAPRR